MTTPEKRVVAQMFAAFRAQDVSASLATVSDDSVWIHHGSQKLISIRFEGKSAVEKFFATNFTTMKIAYFDILETFQDGNTVIVVGQEKFSIVDSGEEKAQKWVQIYTIRDGLIARMEEYATSTDPADYITITE